MNIEETHIFYGLQSVFRFIDLEFRLYLFAWIA